MMDKINSQPQTETSNNPLSSVESKLPQTCGMDCKKCILPFTEKPPRQTPGVGCCRSCQRREDAAFEHSKGDFTKYEDIIKHYGSLDDYGNTPCDVVSFWCRLDFEKA